jgi:dTDP-4-amino-4,6-dideoxy-D-galactose acyltransferase
LERYRILDWDSRLFGFPVARIEPDTLTAERLRLVLDDLRKNGVRLAYWMPEKASPTDPASDAETVGGRFVGERITFTADLRTPIEHEDQPGVLVQRYDPAMGSSDIEDLAVQSGEHSRFATDPGVPRERFVELYTIWIRRSVRKEMADEILVIPDEGRIVAMITLSSRGGSGHIGLVAVDRAFRGRGYGTALMRAARERFVAGGCRQSQVVTQGQNLAACRLYAKYGYTVSKIEYCYHFWL